MKNKRGQTIFGVSFGVIFSVILIMFFIVVTFIVIRAFINSGNCTKIGLFVDDFKESIRDAWNSQSSSFEFSRNLPTNIEYVCFANLSTNFNGNENINEEIGRYEGKNANLFFYPRGKACDMPYHNIDYLDIEKITSSKNPYCVAVNKGKFSIQIEKGFNNNLVEVR
jgi:hypothetical protein